MTEAAVAALATAPKIEIIRRAVKRNAPPVVQITKTFKGQQNLFIEPEQKVLGTDANGGWVTRAAFNGKLEFEITPQNAAVYDPKKIRFVTKAKIQFYNTTSSSWVDYTVDNSSHRWAGGFRRNDGKIYNAASGGSEITLGVNCARFSSPCPVISSTEIQFNSIDKLNVASQEDCFKTWFRKQMQTTDKDKRNRENFEGDHYDRETLDFGTFQTALDRDCVGVEKAGHEIYANGGETWKKFKNTLAMEKELVDNKGQKFFEIPIPNSFTEIEDNRPGWQNFKLTVNISEDAMLLVARQSAASGKGTVLTKNKVRIVYNLRETRIKLPWNETLDEMDLAAFTTDNEILATAEKTQLIVSETFPKKVTQSTGVELKIWSNPFDSFPRKSYFFFMLKSELEGTGNYGRDTFSIKPWNVTEVSIKHGERPIFPENNILPWRPYDRATDGTITRKQDVHRMIYRMQLDADQPIELGDREQRGNGHPDRLEHGLYVGYYNIGAENNGMNGFTEKENVKIKAIVKTDNRTNSADDLPPDELCLVLAFFEQEEIVCVNATANRWETERKMRQTTVTPMHTQSSFGGDPKRY